jgi:DNA polymerase-1
MIPQIGRIKEIVELMNIPLYIKPGYEADDIIGTAVKLASKKGMMSYAITPDKDYMQLVTDKVIVAKPGRGSDEVVFFDPKKVKEEYGFEPKQMIDYLALIGDSSDNIPGVRGIGPKTALPLIQEFGSLENLYKNIDKIEKPGTKKKLEESKENAFLSKELATIYCDVPLEFDFEKAKFEKPNFDKLRDLFIELEFKNLFNRLLKVYNQNVEKKEITKEEISTTTTFDKSKSKYVLITSKEESKKLVEKLSKASLLVFDTETDSLDPFELHIVGASFSTKAGEGYFVAIDPGSTIFSDGKERLAVDDFVKIF